MTDKEHIRTGLDVPKFRSSDNEASVLLSSLKYLGLLAKRSYDKRSPGYIGWPLLMYGFTKLDKLPPWAERAVKKLPGRMGSFLDTYKQVPNAGKRCSILLRAWMAFRMIDDPIDGDAPIKLKNEDKIAFFKERLRRFEEEDWDKRIASDMLCASALKDAEALGIKPMLKEGLLQVLKSMEFDALRTTQEPKFIKRDELEEHYFKLDTEGTGLGMLAILDENIPDPKIKLLHAKLSRAVRIYYDLRDLKKETLQRLINIPAEDAKQYGISIEDLIAFAKSKEPLEKSPEPIRKWIRHQVNEALQLLESSTQLWDSESQYKKPTQDILRTQYYRSAKKFLDHLDRQIPTNLA